MYHLNTIEGNQPLQFHVISSDKDLLGKLTHVMNNRGYVTYWEKSGEMRFILDGRKGVYEAARQLNQVVSDLELANSYQVESEDDKILKAAIYNCIQSYHLPHELKGTGYLFEILYYMLKPGYDHNNLSKGIYQILADKHATEAKLVDRAIRYLRRKINCKESNTVFVHHLLEDIKNGYSTAKNSIK